jgi:hypothetical protein
MDYNAPTGAPGPFPVSPRDGIDLYQPRDSLGSANRIIRRYPRNDI